MVDYTGHAALILLMLALIARPISRLWPQPLHIAALGVGAFVLAVAHTSYMLDHTLAWNFRLLISCCRSSNWHLQQAWH